jgi:non-homologous end joining protein Ku
MALRAYWSGDLAIGPFTIPCQAGAMVGADPEDEALKRLCSCCEQPFTRGLDSCPAGNHPWSQAAEDRGEEDLIDVVYGAPKSVNEDGDVEEWAVLDAEVIREIREQAKLEDLEVSPGEVVSMQDLPTHLFDRAYYVWPKQEKGKAAKKRLESFATLQAALDANDLGLMTMWTPRINSRPALAVVHSVGGVLVMNLMPFRTEVREPEAKITAHLDMKIPERAVEIMGALLGEMRGEFRYGAFVDKTVALRRKAIDEALAGKPITRREREMVDEVDDAPDLMASLEASLASVRSEKSATPAPEKVTA